MSATIDAPTRIIEIISSTEELDVSFNAETNQFSIIEIESGITIQAQLQEGVIFFQLPCCTVNDSDLTAELCNIMLSASNGISTSSFQLTPGSEEGTTVILLSNFAKLQDFGADDEDDIISCISFLMADAIEAHRLIINN
jgi:hypothetical protein